MPAHEQVVYATGNASKIEDAIFAFGHSIFEISSSPACQRELASLDLRRIVLDKLKSARENTDADTVLVDDARLMMSRTSGFPGYLTKYAVRTLGYQRLIGLADDGKCRLECGVGAMSGETVIYRTHTVVGYLHDPFNGAILSLYDVFSLTPDGSTILRDRIESRPRVRAMREVRTILEGLRSGE